MMIPIILFLGMSSSELLLFEIVQTLLDYLFISLIAFAFLKKLFPEIYNLKKILLTALCIEGVYFGTFCIWYFFVHYGIGGFIIELLFLFIVPYIVIYLFYTPYATHKEEAHLDKNKSQITSSSSLSTGKSAILYLVSIPPALFLSCLLTSVIFNLIGIHNIFIFS